MAVCQATTDGLSWLSVCERTSAVQDEHVHLLSDPAAVTAHWGQQGV